MAIIFPFEVKTMESGLVHNTIKFLPLAKTEFSSKCLFYCLETLQCKNINLFPMSWMSAGLF